MIYGLGTMTTTTTISFYLLFCSRRREGAGRGERGKRKIPAYFLVVFFCVCAFKGVANLTY